MAVRIDVEAFRQSVPTAVAEAATRLLSDDSVGELEPSGGGVQAVVRGQDGVFQPWIGIVEGAFTGDCDCDGDGDGEELCAHAVATALAAFDADITFSGAATPPGATPVESDDALYREALRRLSPRQLETLVSEHASRDRLFATRLLGEAGMLAAADSASLDEARVAIRAAASVTTGGNWEIAHIEAAGHDLVTEIEILCARPAAPAMLELVEDAILVWDELSGHLRDAYHLTRVEPEEIADPLVHAHRDLCERLALAPQEISQRLDRLVERCHYELIDTGVYTDLLEEDA